MANGTNPQARRHDLDHEVYIDPKDHKEHINHGMIEYSEEDLKMSGFIQNHEGDEDDSWKARHQDKQLDQYCDNHPDAFECRVYDE